MTIVLLVLAAFLIAWGTNLSAIAIIAEYEKRLKRAVQLIGLINIILGVLIIHYA